MESLDIKELNNDLTKYRVNYSNKIVNYKNKVEYVDPKIDRTTVTLNDVKELKENLTYLNKLYKYLTVDILP